MTINSYHQHIRSQAAPPPTTREEDEKSEIRKREVSLKDLFVVFYFYQTAFCFLFLDNC